MIPKVNEKKRKVMDRLLLSIAFVGLKVLQTQGDTDATRAGAGRCRFINSPL
jgi:hypothetical protein